MKNNSYLESVDFGIKLIEDTLNNIQNIPDQNFSSKDQLDIEILKNGMIALFSIRDKYENLSDNEGEGGEEEVDLTEETEAVDRAMDVVNKYDQEVSEERRDDNFLKEEMEDAPNTQEYLPGVGDGFYERTTDTPLGYVIKEEERTDKFTPEVDAGSSNDINSFTPLINIDVARAFFSHVNNSIMNEIPKIANFGQMFVGPNVISTDVGKWDKVLDNHFITPLDPRIKNGISAAAVGTALDYGLNALSRRLSYDSYVKSAMDKGVAPLTKDQYTIGGIHHLMDSFKRSGVTAGLLAAVLSKHFSLSDKYPTITFNTNSNFCLTKEDFEDLMNYSFVNALSYMRERYNNITNFSNIDFLTFINNNEQVMFSYMTGLYDNALKKVIVNFNDISVPKKTGATGYDAAKGAALGAIIGAGSSGLWSAMKKNKEYNAYAEAERAMGREPMSRVKWLLSQDSVKSAALKGAGLGALGGAATNVMRVNRKLAQQEEEGGDESSSRESSVNDSGAHRQSNVSKAYHDFKRFRDNLDKGNTKPSYLGDVVAECKKLENKHKSVFNSVGINTSNLKKSSVKELYTSIGNVILNPLGKYTSSDKFKDNVEGLGADVVNGNITSVLKKLHLNDLHLAYNGNTYKAEKVLNIILNNEKHDKDYNKQRLTEVENIFKNTKEVDPKVADIIVLTFLNQRIKNSLNNTKGKGGVSPQLIESVSNAFADAEKLMKSIAGSKYKGMTDKFRKAIAGGGDSQMEDFILTHNNIGDFTYVENGKTKTENGINALKKLTATASSRGINMISTGGNKYAIPKIVGAKGGKMKEFYNGEYAKQIKFVVDKFIQNYGHKIKYTFFSIYGYEPTDFNDPRFKNYCFSLVQQGKVPFGVIELNFNNPLHFSVAKTAGIGAGIGALTGSVGGYFFSRRVIKKLEDKLNRPLTDEEKNKILMSFLKVGLIGGASAGALGGVAYGSFKKDSDQSGNGMNNILTAPGRAMDKLSDGYIALNKKKDRLIDRLFKGKDYLETKDQHKKYTEDFLSHAKKVKSDLDSGKKTVADLSNADLAALQADQHMNEKVGAEKYYLATLAGGLILNNIIPKLWAKKKASTQKSKEEAVMDYINSLSPEQIEEMLRGKEQQQYC